MAGGARGLAIPPLLSAPCSCGSACPAPIPQCLVGPQPVPGFGEQIGDRAVFGVAPEARIDVTYFEETRHFADGAAYSLRFPVYDVVETYQPLPADALFSPRMAPPVFGRGLLEAIPEETILALADPRRQQWRRHIRPP